MKAKTKPPTWQRLRDLCQEDGRSTAAIAEAAGGMSAAVLRQILRGERPNPTIATVERVLDALGKTLCDLT